MAEIHSSTMTPVVSVSRGHMLPLTTRRRYTHYSLHCSELPIVEGCSGTSWVFQGTAGEALMRGERRANEYTRAKVAACVWAHGHAALGIMGKAGKIQGRAQPPSAIPIRTSPCFNLWIFWAQTGHKSVRLQQRVTETA